MTGTIPIDVFLEARFAEREAKATAALVVGFENHTGSGSWTADGDNAVNDDMFGEIVVYDEGLPSDDQAQHIAANDPSYVFADLASKRAIVASCVEIIGDRDLTTYGTFGSLAGDRHAMAVTFAVETLRALAGPFAKHPDFVPGWALGSRTFDAAQCWPCGLTFPAGQAAHDVSVEPGSPSVYERHALVAVKVTQYPNGDRMTWQERS